MATGIRVRVDVRNVATFRKRLETFARHELPFVQAAALTDTAKDAVSFLRQGLVEHFKVRNPGLKNGIRFQPASKTDRPPEAYVGTAPWAEFLTFHAIGGTKKGGKGHRIAIPTALVKRTATGRVSARQKPRTLRDSKGFIARELETLQRIAVKRGKKRDGRNIFFLLRSSARIRKRWPFHQEVEETVNARLPHHYLRRMEEALKP